MSLTYLTTAHTARVVFDGTVALFAAGEFQQAFRVRRHEARTVVRDELIFRAAFFAGILMLPIGARLAPAADVGGRWVFIAGVVIGWLGLLLRWWSFVALGRYFTLLVKASADQPIVDRGPYRWLRHPGYAGLIVALLGCGLMLGNGVGALASVTLITAALVYRLRREERALVEARGDAYRDYAKGRARLLPFVW